MHRGQGSAARRQAARDQAREAQRYDRLVFRARVAERNGYVPWPNWAKELAQELDRENAMHREAALEARGGGYVPPVREPYAETAALLQRERDRLTQHLMDAAEAEGKRTAYLHRVASAERAKAGVGRSEPVPLGRLDTMLAVDRAARRRHPEPPKPDLLPLGPRDRRRLETVREQVERRLLTSQVPTRPND